MELLELTKILSRQPIERMQAHAYEANVLSFLTENRLNFKNSEFRHLPFFELVKDRLSNNDSFENFIKYFQFPHAACSLLSDIWNENSKVFAAKDRSLEYVEKRKTDKKVDFNFWQFWQTDGFAAYTVTPNTVFVVYQDIEGLKIIGVPASNIKHIEQSGAKITKLVYQNGDWLWVFEQDKFERWEFKGGKIGQKEDLFKYYNSVPAFFTSNRVVNSKSTVRTNVLNNLYASIIDYLYFSVIGKPNKAFAYWNNIERQVSTIGCVNETTTTKCQGGYMKYKDTNTFVTIPATGGKERCKHCNSLPTVGGVTDIPFRAMTDGSNMGQALRHVAPDTTALEFTAKDERETERILFAKGTGKDQNVDSNKNFNSELSIIYATEGQKAMLEAIAGDLHPNMQRCAEILGEIYHGKNFESARVNVGHDFLLYSKEQLIAIKEKTDSLGITSAMGIDEQLIEVSSNGNESDKRRAKVILLASKILKGDTEEVIARFELKTPIRAINKSANEIVTQIIQDYDLQRSRENSAGQLGTGKEERDGE